MSASRNYKIEYAVDKRYVGQLYIFYRLGYCIQSDNNDNAEVTTKYIFILKLIQKVFCISCFIVNNQFYDLQIYTRPL